MKVDFKTGLRHEPELVKVYEKITRGIWCYKGFFELVDAKTASDGTRKVFKFYLKPVEKRVLGRVKELSTSLLAASHTNISSLWVRG